MTIRKRYAAAFVLAFAAASCNAQTAKPSINDFVGKWVVTDVVDYTDVSGGIPEAKRLLGKTLTITPKSISFDNEPCTPDPGFTVSDVDTQSELDKEFSLRVNETGLPVRSTLLESDNCFPVFLTSVKNKVVFGWNGVIVRAVHDQPKKAQPGSKVRGGS